MKRKKNNEIIFFAGVIVVILIIIGMIVMPDKDQDSASDPNTVADANVTATMISNEVNVPDTPANTEAPTTTVSPEPTVNLADLIANADAWMPCKSHQEFCSKPASDFTITDIDGKEHVLSHYKGKNVIINLWAPWFEPTKTELETLIQLRRAVSADELVILGVSFDSEASVKQHVNRETAINFPIISAATQSLPAPYSTEKPLPCSLFITADGVLKISARGSIPLDDYKALLIAK